MKSMASLHKILLSTAGKKYIELEFEIKYIEFNSFYRVHDQPRLQACCKM